MNPHDPIEMQGHLIGELQKAAIMIVELRRTIADRASASERDRQRHVAHVRDMEREILALRRGGGPVMLKSLRKRITRLEALNRARNVRADRKLQAELDSTKLALSVVKGNCQQRDRIIDEQRDKLASLESLNKLLRERLCRALADISVRQP